MGLYNGLCRIHYSKQPLLSFSHPPPLPGQPRHCCLHETTRRSYYWQSMARNMDRTVSSCRISARNGSTLKHMRHLRCFPATGPLDFALVGNLGPISRKTKSNQYVKIITAKNSNLTRTEPTATAEMTVMVCIFINACVCLFSTPSYLFSDNDTQLVSKCFEIMCTNLSTKQIKTTAYHPQSNVPVKRYTERT